VRFEPRRERDLCNRRTARPKGRCRPLQTEATQELKRSLAHHAAKDAVEVKGRELRESRQRRKIGRLVKVCDELPQDVRYDVEVEVSRVRLHVRRLFTAHRGRLICLAN
jgi:hypothetical protein